MSSFVSSVTSIALVVIFFGGSILFHELGHFIAAKKRKLFVPKFSIGFGPKLFGFKYKGTEFVISLLPLGGYVAVPQLADLKEIEGKYEIPKNSKEATCYDKVIVAAAGPFANIILSFLLAIFLHFIGLPDLECKLNTYIGYVQPTIELPDGTEIQSPAALAGLKKNDKVLSVDGAPVKKFDDISTMVMLGTRKDETGNPISLIEVERDGEKLDLAAHPVKISINQGKDDEFRVLGIFPKQTLIIGGFSKFFDHKNCDLKKEDQILSINGEDVFSIYDFREKVTQSDSTVALKVLRDGKILTRSAKILEINVQKPYVCVSFGNKKSKLCISEEKIENNTHDESQKKFSCIFSDKKFLKKNKIPNEIIECTFDKKFSSVEELANYIKNFSSFDLNLKINGIIKRITIDEISSSEYFSEKNEKFVGISFRDKTVITHPSPIELIRDVTSQTMKTLHGLFCSTSDISVKHLTGPAGLIKTFYMFAEGSFSWLVWFVILVNVNLAIINILPFPILDGGIIMMSLIERMTKWKKLDKVFSKLQSVFFFLLIALVVYVTFFDIKRMITGDDEKFRMQMESMISQNYE